MEIESLISHNRPQQKITLSDEKLHIAILQHYYNATEVVIDYVRKRVAIDIVLDDQNYDPKTINLFLPTVRANFKFKELRKFLMSCIDSDARSLAYYSGIIRDFKAKNNALLSV